MSDQHHPKRRRSLLIKAVLVLMAFGLGYGLYYVSSALAIISAYGAKNLCSGVYVSGRTAQSVIEGELGTALSSLGTYTVDDAWKAASGSVFGLFRREAIYRPGLGCTLVNGTDEVSLRKAGNPLPENIAQLRQQQDTIDWPAGNKSSGILPRNIEPGRLQSAVDAAFQETDSLHPVNTRAVLVVYNDTIIAEKYANGFTAEMPLCGWSMTKSITNALIGI